MFQKVHLRLTLLFTVVSTLILSVMSAFYIYFSYQSLHKNAMLSFQGDISTFTSSFEKNTSISYEWLLELQSNYEYYFYIYDNGVPFRFMQDTQSEEQRRFSEILRSYAQTNVSITENTYKAVHEEFLYCADGERYHVSMIIIPGGNGSSEIYVIHSLHEISVQMQQLFLRFGAIILLSAAALFAFSWFYTKRLLQPIQTSQEKQTKFIAAASHEIRNPVNTIISALGAMDKGSEEQRREFAEIAKKEGKRLTLLTDDLLMLARSDNHSFSAQLTKTELDTLVLECYEAFTAPAREKNIRLSVKLPEHSVTAGNIDGERIRQVISILMDNAVSYTPEGGMILLSCSESAKAYSIEVTDNGIGISDEDKPHIFERFYRADKARESKTHFGLGLCIAKEIVQLHHGTISVKDTVGGGAAFTVTLPK